MTEAIKIIVAGGQSAGKSTFVNEITEISWLIGPPADNSHLPTELGRITVDDDLIIYLHAVNLHLFSTLTLGTGLLDEMDGFCVLVDSTKERSCYEAMADLEYLTLIKSVPHLIVANKQDCEEAMTVGQIRRTMDLPAETLILPCMATEREHVRQVLLTLLLLIRPELQEGVKGWLFSM